MADAAGVQKEAALRQAGFSDQEILQWRDETSNNLRQAGFAGPEIAAYFGNKEPDMSATKEYLEKNLMAAAAAKQGQDQMGPREQYGPVEPQKQAADGILQAIEAGWQMSVTGLIKRGHAPDMILPEDAGRAMRIASQVSQIAGDAPAMFAGAIGGRFVGQTAGAAAGSLTGTVPGIIGGAGVGGVVGAGAGALALPAAMRQILMDHYEKGDIQNFSDFWDRASATMLQTLKQGAIGGLTAGVGGVVGKSAAVLGPVAATGAKTAAEIGTMVTVGKALEGQAPNANDFIDAALLVGGMHGAMEIAPKLRTIYAKTGMKPEQVIEAAKEDPTIQQDLLSSNVEVPKALEPFVDKEAAGKAPFPPEPEKVPLKAPAEMKETSAVLSDEFSPKTGVAIEKTPEPEKPAEEKATPEEESKLTDAEKAIDDRITPSRGKKMEVSLDKVYTAVVDDLHPVKQLERALTDGKLETPDKSPYSQMRLSRGAYGKADQFLELSPFDFKTLENTKGVMPFKKIVEPFKDDLDGLRRYMVSKRALELGERGIETGIPLDAAKEVAEAGDSKYGKAFGQLVDYQNTTLKYLKDSGVLSDDAYGKMLEANKSFVPFFRLMDEESGTQLGKGMRVKNPVKKIEGSSREIIDPIESIIKNTYLYVTLAERNRALLTLKSLADESPRGEELMAKQPAPMRAIEVQKEEVSRFMDAHGIEGDPESFTIFRAANGGLANDEIALYDGGKREVYKVNKQVAKAIQGLDRESSNFVTKLLSIPAAALRVGAVHTPDFLARHLIRDQINAFTLSKEGYFPVVDALKGLGSILKKDEGYQNFLKSGGAISSMISIDRDYIQKHIFELSKETGLIDRAKNVIRTPVELMQLGAELMSNSTRIGEFKRAMQGDKDAAAIFKGGIAARDVTLDYQRIGAQTRAINMISAFFNARLQGLDRLGRAFRDDPVGMTARVGISITAPSVLLWAVNHDDPRWNEIPRWEKDLFWIVMTKNHVFRIPKPFEAGILFGSLPERVLEHYFGKDRAAMKGFAESVASGAAPNFVPTFAQPVLEAWANKSVMTGHSIIPSSMEGIAPEYQYSAYTSETAKMLSKAAAIVPGAHALKLDSPLMMENYIRAWSGNMGLYALKLADQALYKSGAAPEPPAPASTLADIPFVKAFVVRYPSASAQSIQDFNDNYQENQQTLKTIHYLAQQGDLKNMQKELLAQANQDKLMKLDGIHQALATQNEFVRKIYRNPDIKPDEKRQLIDGVYNLMIQQTKLGNQLVDEFRKSVNGK